MLFFHLPSAGYSGMPLRIAPEDMPEFAERKAPNIATGVEFLHCRPRQEHSRSKWLSMSLINTQAKYMRISILSRVISSEFGEQNDNVEIP